MPTNRYVVAPGQLFTYPADAASTQMVRNAGGRSQLTPEQALLVKYKTVKEGDDCSDMPTESLAVYLLRGWVLDTGVGAIKESTAVPTKDKASKPKDVAPVFDEVDN